MENGKWKVENGELKTEDERGEWRHYSGWDNEEVSLILYFKLLNSSLFNHQSSIINPTTLIQPSSQTPPKNCYGVPLVYCALIFM